MKDESLLNQLAYWSTVPQGRCVSALEQCAPRRINKELVVSRHDAYRIAINVSRRSNDEANEHLTIETRCPECVGILRRWRLSDQSR
jgi:hypothetical protein